MAVYLKPCTGCPLRVGCDQREKRAYRDEVYIAHLSKAVDQFNSELADIVSRVQRYEAAA